MTDRIIRIKASRPSYRRAGLDLGSAWLEIDTSTLDVAKQRALLEDSVLTIEGREDDGSWSLLTNEVRQGLLEILVIDAEEAAGAIFGVGDADTLWDAIQANAADLSALEIALDDHGLVIPLMAERIEIELRKVTEGAAEIKRLEGALEAGEVVLAQAEGEVRTLQAELATLKDASAEVERLTAALTEAQAEIETLKANAATPPASPAKETKPAKSRAGPAE